jgi:hypothetical protein
MIFCCPGDVPYKAITRIFPLSFVMNILNCISGAHAVTSWGAEKVHDAAPAQPETQNTHDSVQEENPDPKRARELTCMHWRWFLFRPARSFFVTLPGTVQVLHAFHLGLNPKP